MSEAFDGKSAASTDATIVPTDVHWDQTKMQTSFANVVNVQSTREQFDLFFGTNRTWSSDQPQPVTVALDNRIMLTPFAAKRLMIVLGNVVKDYEARFGHLDIA